MVARPSRPRLVWPCLLMGTLVFASNFRVAPALPDISWFTPDKTAHFFIYGLLATLFLRILAVPGRPGRSLALAVGATGLFGLCDETFQAFNPLRDFSLADLVADLAGATLATTLYQFVPFYRRALEWRLPPARPAPDPA